MSRDVSGMLAVCTIASAARSHARWSQLAATRLSALRAAAAPTAPLFVVTGASGSGKTTILAPLATALAAHCVTFDADPLLDPAAALSRGEPLGWPSFHAALLGAARTRFGPSAAVLSEA